MGKVTFLCILVLTSVEVSAQNDQFLKYDSLSYRAYQENRWEEVIKVGRKALNDGFDYYYLRMRLGISQFNSRNYFIAIRHFKEALNFNSQDQVAIAYLYYCYTLLNLDAEQEKLAHKYTAVLKKASISFRKSGFFKGAFIETGGRVPESGLSISGASFFSAGLIHQLGGSIQLVHNYQRFRQGYEEIIELGRRRLRYNYGIYQNQYFAGSNLRLGNGSNLVVGYHWQHVGGSDISFYNNAIAVGLNKQLGLLQLYGNFYKMQVNEVSINQWTGGIFYYPLGNLDLYFGADVSGFSDRNQLVYNYLIGIKALPTVWINAFYTDGNIQNYLENGGQVFFNNQDQIKNRAGLRLNFYFKDSIVIWLTGFRMENYNEFIAPVAFRQAGAVLGSQINF